ncbi:hypothetical protein ACLBX9_07060 [Methylobacterium sp. A49B]
MGTREFTDEAERRRRRDLVRRIGDAAFGAKIGHKQEQGGEADKDQPRGTWHADFARAIGKATGREIGRARVAQWLLETETAKPVPLWVVDALPVIARAAAADLRTRADILDAVADDAGAPPGAQGEPEAEGEPPQESGPPAAEAAPEGDFDLDALVERVMEAGLSGSIECEDAPSESAPVETMAVWSNHSSWHRQPVRC